MRSINMVVHSNLLSKKVERPVKVNINTKYQKQMFISYTMNPESTL